MIFVADENIDAVIVARLRQEGHSVSYVAESDPGITDAEVLGSVPAAEAILLTADKDFGELIFRQRKTVAGVLLVRLAGLSAGKKADIVTEALRVHAKDIAMAFAVLTPGALRIRRQS